MYIYKHSAFAVLSAEKQETLKSKEKMNHHEIDHVVKKNAASQMRKIFYVEHDIGKQHVKCSGQLSPMRSRGYRWMVSGKRYSVLWTAVRQNVCLPNRRRPFIIALGASRRMSVEYEVANRVAMANEGERTSNAFIAERPREGNGGSSMRSLATLPA